MKKNVLTVLMLAGILLSASCTKDEVEAPTLQLSETGTITLPKAASEKAVTVTTNQAEWTSMANVDWIELTQSGTTLTIKVEENYSSVMRKAEVMVLAGGLGKKLAVEQSESDLTIVTIPDKLEVNQWGGTFQFDVDANTDDWNIASNAEWLKATPKQFKKEVVLEIEENTVREERTAVLTITSGGNTLKEFTVTQSGIMYYILPYLQVETSLGGIIAFENTRRSTYVPDYYAMYYDEHTFETLSPAFPIILYMNYSNLTSEIDVFASSADFVKDPEFEKMMEDEGFEHTSETLYTKESTQGESKFIIEALIVVGEEEDDESGIIFTFRPVQPGPMPTFEELPYGFMHFGSPDGTLENVRAWESENGGVYNTSGSSPDDGFYWFDASPPWLIRAYIFEDQDYLLQTMNIFEDIPMFFYYAAGTYYMTDEFKALKDKEGFTNYLGSSTSGLAFYGSDDTPYQLAIAVKRYSDVLKGEPIVEMRFDLANKNGGGSVLSDMNRNRYSKDKSPKALSHKAINRGK